VRDHYNSRIRGNNSSVKNFLQNITAIVTSISIPLTLLSNDYYCRVAPSDMDAWSTSDTGQFSFAFWAAFRNRTSVTPGPRAFNTRCDRVMTPFPKVMTQSVASFSDNHDKAAGMASSPGTSPLTPTFLLRSYWRASPASRYA
jgi:hypothetical protein